MNKIVSTKNANAIFLATVLVLGTIAAISPSFMVGAQAQQYYGQDNNYKKSYGKDVTVKSVKCNNVNVNVNGLELTALPPSLSGLLTNEAQATDEGQYGASSYGSGEQSDNSNFKFICINNNNNTVIVVNETLPEPPIPPIPPTPTCDDCFAALPENVQAAVNSILETIPPEGLPQDTTPPLIIPTTVGSIPELCEFLENNIRGVTPEQRESLITTFADVPGSSQEIATALIDCLIDVGIFNLIAS